MKPVFSRPIQTLLIVFATCTIGCTKTYHARVAGFHPGEEQLMGQAPRTAVYSVKWTGRQGKGMQRLDGTTTLVNKGEPLGFETQSDGKVVAIAGERRLVMDQLPSTAGYCIWYSKDVHETHFGKEVRKTLDATGEVLGATVPAVVGGALIAGGVYLELHDHHYDDDFDDDDR